MNGFVRPYLTILAAALAIGWSAPVASQNLAGGTDLFSKDSLELYVDLRGAVADGERGWTDGGFGKLRFDGQGDGSARIHGTLAEAALVWQPKFSWTLSGTVVALVQDAGKLQPGLSEAYLSWKPLSSGRVRVAARAGLMWPPISLEHQGPQWAVADTITPSAINSWIGEEVKVGGVEGTVTAALGAHRLGLTAGLFDANDTAGALMTFRGWALHDLKGLGGRTFKLPQLDERIEYYQPRYTHSLLEIDGGFFKRVGGYAKLSWQGPWPVRAELAHYDNGGDPEVANVYQEWAWRTQFDHIGLVAEPAAGLRLTAQAMRGRARMGFVEAGRRWIDTRFRSAFLLGTRSWGEGSLSARVEAFGTDSRGAYVADEDSEHGWAATFAGRRPIGDHATALIELLHVSSRREARLRDSLAPRQDQTQLQASLRLHW